MNKEDKESLIEDTLFFAIIASRKRDITEIQEGWIKDPTTKITLGKALDREQVWTKLIAAVKYARTALLGDKGLSEPNPYEMSTENLQKELSQRLQELKVPQETLSRLDISF